MGQLAADYSYSRPDPRALWDAGYRIVMRYLGTDSRCITPTELRRLHDTGLMVGLIGQSTITRPRGGYPAGVYDAQRYNQLADTLSAPDWLPIFYVVDVGEGFPAVGDYGAIRDYAAGILATPGRPVGFYGPYPVLEMLRDLEVNLRRIVCWWQTAGGSGSGPGTGGGIRTGDGSTRRLSSLACMFQHFGLTGPFGDAIDRNDVLMESVTWAWHPAIAAHTDPPAKPKQEDEMLTIYWTAPGSTWVADEAHLDNTISQGFRVEGPFARYIGERARPGHEGWDDRTQAVRAILALQGFGDGQREADAPDALMRTLCLLPDALGTATATVDIGAIVNGLRQPVTDTINAVLASRGVDVHEGALADAVAAELAERLQS
jgi:hypothetical protein